MGDPSPVRGGRAKRYYALTSEGEDALVETRLIRELLWSPPDAVRS
jgi:DNA-binding PadR family transcriptional regulator